MKQNITLKLDTALIQKAKIRAVQQGTSLSGLLTRYLEKVLQEDDEYATSRTGALRLLRHGFHLGGKAPARREELDER